MYIFLFMYDCFPFTRQRHSFCMALLHLAQLDGKWLNHLLLDSLNTAHSNMTIDTIYFLANALTLFSLSVNFANSSSTGKNTWVMITTVCLLILYFFKVALSPFRLTVRINIDNIKGSSSVVVTRFQRSYPSLPNTMETTLWNHKYPTTIEDLSKRNLLDQTYVC